MDFCPNCGHRLAGGPRFCPDCGACLESPAETAEGQSELQIAEASARRKWLIVAALAVLAVLLGASVVVVLIAWRSHSLGATDGHKGGAAETTRSAGVLPPSDGRATVPAFALLGGASGVPRSVGAVVRNYGDPAYLSRYVQAAQEASVAVQFIFMPADDPAFKQSPADWPKDQDPAPGTRIFTGKTVRVVVVTPASWSKTAVAPGPNDKGEAIYLAVVLPDRGHDAYQLVRELNRISANFGWNADVSDHYAGLPPGQTVVFAANTDEATALGIAQMVNHWGWNTCVARVTKLCQDAVTIDTGSPGEMSATLVTLSPREEAAIEAAALGYAEEKAARGRSFHADYGRAVRGAGGKLWAGVGVSSPGLDSVLVLLRQDPDGTWRALDLGTGFPVDSTKVPYDVGKLLRLWN